MSYNMSKNKQNEIRKLNKLLQNKESRLRSKGIGVVGIFGDSKFPIKKINEFTSTREVNEYIKDVQFALKRTSFQYVETGNEYVPFIDKNLHSAYSKSNKIKKQELASLNEQVKELASQAIATNSGMTLKQYKTLSGVAFAGVSGLKNMENDATKHARKVEYITKQTEKNIKRKNNVMDKKQEMQEFKKNYIKAIKKTFTLSNGKLSKEGEKLIDQYKSMTVEEFATLYYSGNITNIETFYESDRLHAIYKILNSQTEHIKNFKKENMINYDKLNLEAKEEQKKKEELKEARRKLREYKKAVKIQEKYIRELEQSEE